MKSLKKKNEKDTEDQTDEDDSESSLTVENVGQISKQIINEENNGVMQTDGSSGTLKAIPEKQNATTEMEKTNDPS